MVLVFFILGLLLRLGLGGGLWCVFAGQRFLSLIQDVFVGAQRVRVLWGRVQRARLLRLQVPALFALCARALSRCLNRSTSCIASLTIISARLSGRCHLA